MSDSTREEFGSIANNVLKLKANLYINSPTLNVATCEAIVTDIADYCNKLVPLKEEIFEELMNENDVVELPDDNTLTSILVYGDDGYTLRAMTGALTGNITRLFNDVDFHTGTDIQQLISVNQQKELITVILIQRD
ncbi:hypothetical protein TSMG0081 [Halocynthia phage JM-2012]|uniref:hypothetical protein n=1 Tax=Halocynthia phage JM-2012 TaxID=1173297 RepID=UPI00025C6925|nr:hypothetical protein TSMG0081 [Halocynthia phage JM-2012]AFI55364.1 hypothetical protein TSMG0081 [Halocynthia phage JM-2012]